MSSAPCSPPRTPSKSTMAIGNENLNTTPRTPLPDAPIRTKGQTSMKPPPSPLKLSQTPAPSSIPDFQNGKAEEQEKPRSADRIVKFDERNSEPLTDATEDENAGIDDEQATGHDTDVELEPIDWNDFDQRYGDKIERVAQVEDDLQKEFQILCQSFTFWASAATSFDENRGWKRLKTRQRYVQMTEANLMAKKEHYVQVVEAFKTALELLGEPKE